MMMMKSGHEPLPILHERLEMDTDDMTADALLGARVASPTQTLRLTGEAATPEVATPEAATSPMQTPPPTPPKITTQRCQTSK